jgi:hypothetical protein
MSCTSCHITIDDTKVQQCQLVKQLKAYYAKWKTRLGVKEALSLTLSECQPVTHLIQNLRCSHIAPTVLARQLQPHYVPNGLPNINKCNPTPLPPANLTGTTSGNQTSATAINHHLGSNNIQQPIEMHAQLWVTTQIEKSKSTSRPWKPRSCKKCAEPDCPSEQRVTDCKNCCRDCNIVECVGRDSQKPHLKCYNSQVSTDI